MSRIGRKPIGIPSGVSIEISGANVTVKGPKGELTLVLLPEVTVKVDGDTVTVERVDDTDQSKARHGLMRQLISNMVIGVSDGYTKELEIIGVGYKAQVSGKKLNLSLGFSHPVEHAIPEGIEITIDEKNKNILIVKGIDKQLVGQVSAEIRAYRPPEPYKGKGVRYRDEHVQRKVGKAAAKTE